MRTTTTCPVCGTEYTRVHTSYKTPKHCSRACANRAPGRMTAEIRARIGLAGDAHPNFKGGWISVGSSGHRHYRVPVPLEERANHPTVDSKGYMPRSHYLWNLAHPDDPVLRGQVIHHLNEDSLDDRVDNFEKCASQSEHWQRFHAKEVAARSIGTRRRDERGRLK